MRFMISCHRFLGADGQPTALSFLQMGLRGLVVFLAGLGLVRISDRRSLAEKTGFDIIFLILIGSILSRAINGTAPFFVTIGAATVLMVMHRVFSFAASRSHRFGVVIKGEAYTLIPGRPARSQNDGALPRFRARSRGRLAAPRPDRRHFENPAGPIGTQR
jgi:hypothetical protein